MRKYEKPQMKVERYQVKNAVATGCYWDEGYTFPAQSVSCVINGSESIFDLQDAGSACQHDVDTGYFGSDGTNFYFTWYNGEVYGRPSDEQTAQLAAIASLCRVTLGDGTSGWHAGSVSAESYRKMNSTS